MKKHGKWAIAGAVMALVLVSSVLSFHTHTTADTAINCQSSNSTIPSDALSVLTYNAKPDGATDDTASIQAAITDAANKNLPLYFPAGTYMVQVNKIKLQNNSQLYLDNNAIVQAFGNNLTGYYVFLMQNVSNVGIAGGTISGERNTHTGTGGEWGMALEVLGASNSYVKGMTLENGWGDGLYISNKTNNFTACYDTMVNNRRNNISVIDGTNITLDDLILKHANGTAPQAGIDFEPDATNSINGAVLENTTISDNMGAGIDVTGNYGPVSNVTIENDIINNSQLHGLVVVDAQNIIAQNNTITNSGLAVNSKYNDIIVGATDTLTLASNTLNSSNVKNAIWVGTDVKNATVTNNCFPTTEGILLPTTATASNNGTSCQLASVPAGVSGDASGGGPSVNATPPTLYLKGDNPITLHVGDTFTDPGATAKDVIDGDISSSIAVTNAVDTSRPGSYLVGYRVGDSTGNQASTNRTVIVLAAAAPIVSAAAVVPPAQVPPAPPAIATGFWSFIPFINKTTTTAPKAPTTLRPTLPTPKKAPVATAPSTTSADNKKSYTVTKITYALNGATVHISNTFPDTWQLDTSVMADGTYTLVSTLQYGDGRTDSSSETFVVDNTPSFWQRIQGYVKNEILAKISS